MRHLVCNGRDHAGLVIVVRNHADPRHAAQCRHHPIRPDNQRRAEHLATPEGQPGEVGSSGVAGDLGPLNQLGTWPCCLEQHPRQQAVGDHMGVGLARRDIAFKGEKHRTREIAAPRIGDLHGADRLRLGEHRTPYFQRLEHPPHSGGEREGPLVVGHGEAAPVDQSHAHLALKAGECQCQAQPDGAAADDNDIIGTRGCHDLTVLPRGWPRRKRHAVTACRNAQQKLAGCTSFGHSLGAFVVSIPRLCP